MSIELKSISCKGVKSLAFLQQKPSLSVAASLVSPGDSSKRQLQRTPVDRHGGRNPEWNQLMRFDFGGAPDALPLLLEFVVTTHGGVLGSKVVGRVHVPVADLLTPTPSHNHVRYQVRAPDRRPNGELAFTYKKVDPAVTTPSSPHPTTVLYPLKDSDCSNSPSPATSWGHLPIADTCSIYPPLPDRSPVYIPPSPWTSDLAYDSPKMSSVYPSAAPTPSVEAYPPPVPDEAFETPNSFYYPTPMPARAACHVTDVYCYPPPPPVPSTPAYAYSYGYSY